MLHFCLLCGSDWLIIENKIKLHTINFNVEINNSTELRRRPLDASQENNQLSCDCVLFSRVSLPESAKII